MTTNGRIRLLAVVLLAAPSWAQETEDPNLWLEEILGEKALAWVEKNNAAAKAKFTAHPAFQPIYDNTLAILNAKDRLVGGAQFGEHIYNFWRDASHPRGIYRRAPIASYLANKPEWDVLLDIDALAKSEGKSWVYKGMDLRYPDYDRGLLRLSDGGADAVTIREFDLTTKTFVEDGFKLPEAKGGMDWVGKDHVYVQTNFGEGTLTDSGYARIVKLWKRGTPLSEAKTLHEGKQNSVSVGAWRANYPGGEHLDYVYESTSFYTSNVWLREGDKFIEFGLPDTAEIQVYYKKQLFIELKKDWKVGTQTYLQGSLISIPLADLKAGKKNFKLVMAPSESVSLQSVKRTKNYVIVQVMDNVRDRLYRCELKDSKWIREEIKFEGSGTIRASSIENDRDSFFVTYRSFLRPATLYSVDAKTLERTVLQQAPARFDGTPYESHQYFAKSKDGTSIPYFIVHSKKLEKNGKNRTLLYGYGGFRSSMRPFYLSSIGKNWLERGGVYVLANIRGGGEFGPRWHAAALRENRHKAFEDFEAIAEDLIARKITSPSYLAIRGGSNGGLLVGACFTRRPELFGAVICQVPLLDMKRYNKLLAGASWMAEYGNPDVSEDWAFIRNYSPYHNVKKDKRYPRVFFTTSTRDDRVHPAHARKMVARMTAMGHPVYYYENTEGGHAGAANAKQRAYASALAWVYLLDQLGPEK